MGGYFIGCLEVREEKVEECFGSVLWRLLIIIRSLIIGDVDRGGEGMEVFF